MMTLQRKKGIKIRENGGKEEAERNSEDSENESKDTTDSDSEV